MVYPIVAVRSSGSKLWDVDGNEVHRQPVESRSWSFPSVHQKAVEGQLSGVQMVSHHWSGKVQKRCELTGTERVCNTGSEAVLAAMRVARTVTGRNKIAIFANDYHGMFDEVLVRSSTMGGKSRTVPVSRNSAPKVENMLVLEYGNPQSLEVLTEQRDLAAVLVEPVQSRHPDLQQGVPARIEEWTQRSR